ncbi:MAG: hypothetical protein M1833_006950 [Piccolia ochrophora]|nr:MAG: hypothetical protein M1833_006950 [Piccolia ochrophora]
MSHRISFTFFLLVVPVMLSFSALTVRAAAAEDTCYFPSGLEASGFAPCKPSAAARGPFACCFKRETCLSNGLCFGPKHGMPYRGACTDPDWKDEKCATACMNVRDNYAFLSYRGNDDDQFACGAAPNVCNSTIRVKWIAATVLGPAPSTKNDSASETSASASSSVSSSAECATADADIDAAKRTIGLGVGVGTGVPLLAALAAAMLLWLSERSKRRQAEQTLSEGGSVHGGALSVKTPRQAEWDYAPVRSANPTPPPPLVPELGASGSPSELGGGYR